MAKRTKRKSNELLRERQQKESPGALALSEDHKQKKLAVYIRVSTERQADEQTDETQKQRALDYVRREFGPEAEGRVEIFADLGYNMEYLDESREVWRLMTKVEAGEIDSIVVFSADRLFRSSYDAIRGKIIDTLKNHRVNLYEVSSSQPTEFRRGANLSATLPQVVLPQIGAAEKEAGFKRRWDGWRQKLLREGFFNSALPFGYRYVKESKKVKRLVIERKEAEAVRHIFRLYVGEKTGFHEAVEGGRSYREVADILTSEGVSRDAWCDSGVAHNARPTWTLHAVSKIIINSFYVGSIDFLIRPGSEFSAKAIKPEIVKLSTPRIVSDQLWRRAQESRRARTLLKRRLPRFSETALRRVLVFGCCDKTPFFQNADAERDFKRWRLSCSCTTRVSDYGAMISALLRLVLQNKKKIIDDARELGAASERSPADGFMAAGLRRLEAKQKDLEKELKEAALRRKEAIMNAATKKAADRKALMAETARKKKLIEERLVAVKKKISKEKIRLSELSRDEAKRLEGSSRLGAPKSAGLSAASLASGRPEAARLKPETINRAPSFERDIETLMEFLLEPGSEGVLPWRQQRADDGEAIDLELIEAIFSGLGALGFQIRLGVGEFEGRPSNLEKARVLGRSLRDVFNEGEIYALYRLGYISGNEARTVLGISRHKLTKSFGQSSAAKNRLNAHTYVSLESSSDEGAHGPDEKSSAANGGGSDSFERLAAPYFYRDLTEPGYEPLSEEQIRQKPLRIKKPDTGILKSPKKTIALAKKFGAFIDDVIIA